MATVFDRIPGVSFVGSLTLEQEAALEIADFQNRYKELTGTSLVLPEASPWRILLLANAARNYQMMLLIDYQGRMNMLKYAEGDYLDNYAARFGLERSEGSAATVTIRFTLSDAQVSVIAIPQGTRVSNGAGVYFATDEYAEISAGSLHVDVPCTCTELGTDANGVSANTLTTLVDLIPYVASVTNAAAPSGGTDREDDETLRLRIYSARAAFNTAGSREAYKYWVRSYSSQVADVMIPDTHNAGVVPIYVLLEDGALPDSSFLSGLVAYLDDDTKRPLTDTVTASAPVQTSFNITFTYYINQSDRSTAAAIQAQVNAAVDEYIAWQTAEIGRDINPNYLAYLVMAAGAKRLVITAPVYTVIADNGVPVLNSRTVTYGGIEND